MANPEVETVSTGADKAKLAAAGVLVIAAVAAFYALAQQDLWLRVVTLLVVLAGAVAVFFMSENGKALIAFGRDSVREVKNSATAAPSSTSSAPTRSHRSCLPR